MHYCYEIAAARSILMAVIIQLQENKLLVRDFGSLYTEPRTNKKTTKKTVGEFITQNKVRVKAMSIGKSPRGDNFVIDEGSFRPDLVGLDDIDTTKSVANSEVIDKNYEWLRSEMM